MKKKTAIFLIAAVAALTLILSAWLIIAGYPRDISFTLPAYAISDELKMKTELEITGKLKKHIFGTCKYSFSGFVVVDAIPYTQKNDAWPVELQFVASDLATDERVLIATGLYNSPDGTPKTRPDGFCTLTATEDFTTLILELGSYKGDFSGWVVAPANDESEAEDTLGRFLEKHSPPLFTRQPRTATSGICILRIAKSCTLRPPTTPRSTRDAGILF